MKRLKSLIINIDGTHIDTHTHTHTHTWPSGLFRDIFMGVTSWTYGDARGMVEGGGNGEKEREVSLFANFPFPQPHTSDHWSSLVSFRHTSSNETTSSPNNFRNV